MHIKIPQDMESPTVVIIGQKKVDNKINAYHERRMDLLERKLDTQYKAFMDKTDNTKIISELQKSFISALDRFMQMNKSMMSSMHKEKMSGLRREFMERIKDLSEADDRGEIVKSFMGKLGRLEGAIKNIKPITISTTRSISHDYLSKSFDGFYARMQKLVESARPRLIPSPS